MLGRTANDLFWLSRYVERAENMARLIEVGFRIVLVPRGDSPLDDGTLQHDWSSTLQSACCEELYLEKHTALTTRDVVNFLVFDSSNPSSIRTCLATARRSARAQRTALTREMWECLNSSWIEFEAIDPEFMTSNTLLKLLDWVKERSAAYRGALLNTILRNDTFYFSQLGTFLERSDNTARILDVKYFVLLPRPEMVGSSVDNAQWGAILRSVSAHRSYRWVYKDTYRAAGIADFLILNSQMPRSLCSCYGEISSALEGLEVLYKNEVPSTQKARQTHNQLVNGSIDGIFSSGLHEFLTSFITGNNTLGSGISADYHFTV
jgi:uncharacterized alpha-E superfamily protein